MRSKTIPVILTLAGALYAAGLLSIFAGAVVVLASLFVWNGHLAIQGIGFVGWGVAAFVGGGVLTYLKTIITADNG